MVGRFSVRSIVGLATLGFACNALVLAQAPAPAQGRGGGAGAPRPTPAALVMSANFQPAEAGKTEQLPFVQANVADADIELKQYGAGKRC